MDHFYTSILLEPFHLLDQEIYVLKDGLISGEVYVVLHHEYEERGLATVQVVGSGSVRNESVMLDQIEIVFNDTSCSWDVVRPEKGFDNPICVPIVNLL